MAVITNFRDLIVYRKSFDLASRVFELTKGFPKEEKYALTDQIRRSSRSVCANLAEAWAKKLYPKAFVSKLSDSLAEQLETEVWLDFCVKHQYIDKETYCMLLEDYAEIRRMLSSMMNSPEKFSREQ